MKEKKSFWQQWFEIIAKAEVSNKLLAILLGWVFILAAEENADEKAEEKGEG